MLTKTLAAVVVAAFAVSAGFEYAPAPASAAMPYGNFETASPDSNIQLVAKKWVYVPGKHGKRYKKKYPGYGYKYNGYWYKQPWWTYGGGAAWVYGPKYGKRYRNKYPGYGYYYGGWYYPRPWWRPGVTICIGC